MYRQFFKLRQNPFLMTPDPSFIFLTREHQEALAGLTYAILGKKGFVVLTGDAGTGKTTLIARVLQAIPATRAQCSVIFNPTLTSREFLEITLSNLGVRDVPESKAQRLLLLQRLLTHLDAQGKVPALIIDEAHKLPPDVLEEIRLLSNFEKPDGKLLQIVLVGQNELRDVLNRDDLRQLKQRISVRLSIGPLASSEIERYIGHRWARAGGTDPHPFSAAVMEEIGVYTRGIPRLINALCDNTLMLAYAQSSSQATLEHLRAAAADLDLLPMNSPPAFSGPAAAPSPDLRHAQKAANQAALHGPPRFGTLERYSERKKSSVFSKWSLGSSRA